MHFDFTINIGNVVSVATLVVTFYVSHVRAIRHLENLDTKVNLVFDWFQKNVINKE